MARKETESLAGGIGEVRATRDPASFDAVYRAYVRDVLRHLQRGFGYVGADGVRRYHRVESRFDAEELCQEAFSVFFDHCLRGNFDIERPVRPYLLRIAANLALRRARRSAREVVETPPPRAVEPAPEADELGRLLDEFRATLGEHERRVLTACFVDEQTQAGAGARLGLSRDQVYRSIVKIRRAAWRFFRARGWLDDA